MDLKKASFTQGHQKAACACWVAWLIVWTNSTKVANGIHWSHASSFGSGPEVGVRDLFLGGFGATRPKDCFLLVFSGDGFFAVQSKLAAIDV